MLEQNIYQQQIVNWSFPRSVFKSSHVHSLQSLCQPTKMYCRYCWHMKNIDVFYIYFFGQWFVEIKLKKLSILTCEFVSNFVARYWYKMVATPCSRHGLWLCKAILWVSTKIDHFFLTYTKKCDRRNFLHIGQALIGSSKLSHVGVFVNYFSQQNV